MARVEKLKDVGGGHDEVIVSPGRARWPSAEALAMIDLNPVLDFRFAIPVSTLVTYAHLVLPRLADGPKTELDLGIPRYALKYLQEAGLVRMRTQSRGCLAWQFWYRAEDFPAPVRDCGTITFEEFSGAGSLQPQEKG